jgi:hypothetical protein
VSSGLSGSGGTLNVGTYSSSHSGYGGNCLALTTGAQQTFVAQRMQVFMIANPLSSGEASALASLFRGRLGF